MSRGIRHPETVRLTAATGQELPKAAAEESAYPII